LNWVLVFAGLLPLWAAIFIIFSNMRALKEAPELMELSPVQVEKPIQNKDIEEKPEEKEQKSIFSGLLGRFKRGKTEETPSEGEINFTEPSSLNEGESALGLPRGLRRLWGATFLLMFLACLAYGSEMALDYIFKEYRWVIGTTNPWTSQLQFATLSASSIAGIATMISTLKTGLFLLKD